MALSHRRRLCVIFRPSSRLAKGRPVPQFAARWAVSRVLSSSLRASYERIMGCDALNDGICLAKSRTINLFLLFGKLKCESLPWQ